MQKKMMVAGAMILALAAQPAFAQQAGSKEKAKLMFGACSEDFYSPMRASCIWWLRGAIEGHQAATDTVPQARQFCFEPKWPNPVFAAVAEEFPCGN